MTKTLYMRLFLAVSLVSLSGAVAAWADPPSQVGRLSLIVGEVSFHPASLDEWAPATLNYPLGEGDHVWTDSGARAEVQVLAAAIRLNSGTEFSFLALDDRTVQVRLTEGSVNVSLRAVEEGTIFEVDTPNAAVILPVEGSYRIDVMAGGETSVTSRSGSAQVTTGGDFFDVPAGQGAVVSGSDSVAYYVTGASEPDEWDAWCAGRDQRAHRVSSNPYVSREMIGADDLTDNGSWIVAAGYGPAWVPSSVPAGWAPYRYGHWAWVEPWGWTWIDDMAWGFAPFHYGRWAFLNARWVWVPGAAVARPVYAPALVVFVGGEGWTPAAGAGIGWFPLGPREVYVPPYRVSPTYVQRINVAHVTNINQQYIERYDPHQAVYVNRMAPRGVTYVSREVFVQSRPAGGAFLNVSPMEITRAPIGMTATVVPQRESVFAQPFTPRNPVPQPPPSAMTRRVYSRTAPPPPQVPFSERQQVHRANPGRPIDPETYSRMQRDSRYAPPPVTVVRPGQPIRPAPGQPQRVAPDDQRRPAPGQPQRVMTPAPEDQGRPLSPQQGGRQRVTPIPDDQRRPAPGQPRRVTPIPEGERRPVAPSQGQPRRVTPIPEGERRPVVPAAEGPARQPQAERPAEQPRENNQSPAMRPPRQEPAEQPRENNQSPAMRPPRQEPVEQPRENNQSPAMRPPRQEPVEQPRVNRPSPGTQQPQQRQGPQDRRKLPQDDQQGRNGN